MGVQLTKNQHIVPAKSISRFCDNGKVWVERRTTDGPFHATPRNKVFCEKRAWEERSESNHKDIEDAFQEVADDIDSGKLSTLDQERSNCISAMFALWVARSCVAEKPLVGLPVKSPLGNSFPPDRKVNGWTSDERDLLEAKFFVVSDPDGSIPGRMMAWPHMQRQIAKIRVGLSGIRWGILQAEESEFLLPDRFCRDCFLPLSPRILLVAGHCDESLSAAGVAKVNEIAKSDFREWVISKSHF